MFKTITAAAFISALTLPAFADTQHHQISKDVRHVEVTDVFEHATIQEPITQRVCRQVSGGGGDAAGGALAGMIIGGILGKGVTGKDNGAAAGAVIGGIIGADKGSQGSITQTRCDDEVSYVEKKGTSYQYSIIHFRYQGQWYSLKFVK